MSSFPSGASSTSDENEPHIEELLYSRLQKEKFIAKDSGPKETLRRVEESASEGREDFIDHSRSASGDNSGGDPGELAYRPHNCGAGAQIYLHGFQIGVQSGSYAPVANFHGTQPSVLLETAHYRCRQTLAPLLAN
ncbi:hypothetical protein B0O99DRAFT_377937 [Bisporella sp. PMI_857]|nr:hypothetical protein B0O99DRAFT_377937 [Bisporella sp. PMI_857]